MVASYCATFLKPEMLHIYRQIVSLQRVRPIVLAQKREEEARFPFPDITLVPKPKTHFLRRIWFKQLRDVPWQLSRSELENLRRVLAEKQAQLLHIYFGHIAVHLLPLMTAWDRPTVVSFHGADVLVDLEKPAYLAATRRMLEAAKLVLVRSESLGRALIEIGCPAEKLRVHRTGIPTAEIPFQQRDWPREGAWRFVQACRLIEKKGLLTSLRAFAKIASAYPASTFTIAGEGPLRASLEAQANSFGLGDRVRFTGFLAQDKLRALFAESHIFLHPSERGADGNQEGVPNSMLEAMASGLPVFATAHGGIPEAIVDGESGHLVAEGDAGALANKLADALRDPRPLDRIARAGADSVARNFERGAQTRQLEDYYFEAMRMPSIETAEK